MLKLDSLSDKSVLSEEYISVIDEQPEEPETPPTEEVAEVVEQKPEFSPEELENVIIELTQEKRRYTETFKRSNLVVVMQTLLESEQAMLNNEIQIISLKGHKSIREVYYKNPASEDALITGEKNEVYIFADKSRQIRFAELYFFIDSINGETSGEDKLAWLKSYPTVILDYIYLYMLSKFKRKVESALKSLPVF